MKNTIEKDNTVCVLGLGYVGLTLATVLSDVGFVIFGVDKNKQVVDSLKIGKSHFYEKEKPFHIKYLKQTIIITK